MTCRVSLLKNYIQIIWSLIHYSEVLFYYWSHSERKRFGGDSDPFSKVFYSIMFDDWSLVCLNIKMSFVTFISCLFLWIWNDSLSREVLTLQRFIQLCSQLVNIFVDTIHISIAFFLLWDLSNSHGIRNAKWLSILSLEYGARGSHNLWL